MDFHPTRKFALQHNQGNPLYSFRNQFVIDSPNLIYLDGNSLGRLPKNALSAHKRWWDMIEVWI